MLNALLARPFGRLGRLVRSARASAASDLPAPSDVDSDVPSTLTRPDERPPVVALPEPRTGSVRRRLLQPRTAAPARHADTAPGADDPAFDAGLPSDAARRPLVGADGRLVGFEFCADSPLRARLRQDPGAARDSTLALLAVMRRCADAGQVALAELPAAWLAAAVKGRHALHGIWLVLGADALFDDHTACARLVDRLRSNGARVGWRKPAHPDNAVPAGRPDFLPVAASNRAADGFWREAVNEAASLWPELPQVLLDLPPVDTMEELLVAPVVMATCAAGLCDAPGLPQPLPRAAERLLAALGLLASLGAVPGGAAAAAQQRRDQDRLLQLLQTEPALNLDLAGALAALRNDAPGGGGAVRLAAERGDAAPPRPADRADAVPRAVERGEGNLLRHAAARALLRQASARPAGRALAAQALARARLMEQWALCAREPAPGQLFVLGLASMLPLLLRCDPDDALAPLLLPPESIAALGEQSGPWMRYLALLRSLERHDMVAAEALALPVGGLERALSLAGWCWQEQWRSGQHDER